MKEFSGSLWSERSADGRIRIGFSRQFIENKLGECFHVMQADMRAVKKGEPLLVIETNDGLESLKSPVAGSILYFNPKARDFPDRLMEEDNILEILPEGVKLPAAKTKTVKLTEAEINSWVFRQEDNLFNQPPQAPPPPPAPINEVERQRAIQNQALQQLAQRQVRRPR